jgi:hypothetical protein
MRRMKLSDLQAQKRQMFVEMMQRGDAETPAAHPSPRC